MSDPCSDRGVYHLISGNSRQKRDITRQVIQQRNQDCLYWYLTCIMKRYNVASFDRSFVSTDFNVMNDKHSNTQNHVDFIEWRNVCFSIYRQRFGVVIKCRKSDGVGVGGGGAYDGLVSFLFSVFLCSTVTMSVWLWFKIILWFIVMFFFQTQNHFLNKSMLSLLWCLKM